MNDNFLKARKIVLIFHGIDTFANVSLNNHILGETSNMFLRYIFDVTDFIKVIKEIEKVMQNIRIDNTICLFDLCRKNRMY